MTSAHTSVDTDDEGEHPRRETGRGCTPERRHREPEPEECGVRDGLVEDVPAPIGDDRPPDRRAEPGDEEHERAEQDRAGAADPRSGDSAERDSRRGPPPTGRLRRHRPAASRASPSRHRRTSHLRATPPRGLRRRGRRPRNGARTAPTPSPWRATLAPGPGFLARGKWPPGSPQSTTRRTGTGRKSRRLQGSSRVDRRARGCPTPPTKAGYAGLSV